MSNTPSADDVIDRLKVALGIVSDADLCRRFKLAPATVSNWRNRDSVPFAFCVSICQQNQISLDWILLGRGSREWPPTVATYGKANDWTGERIGEYQATRGTDPESRPNGFKRWLLMWWATAPDDERTWMIVQLKKALPDFRSWLEGEGRE